jgi:hypothetical protein
MERGKYTDGERTTCISEWGFSPYVFFGHCEILFCSVVQFRNACA